MTSSMKAEETTITPAFEFDGGELSTVLGTYPASVCIDGNAYTGNGEARLNLLPRAGIRFFGEFHGVPGSDTMMILSGQKQISTFSLNGVDVDGFFLSIGGDISDQEMNISWAPKSQPICCVGSDNSTISKVVVHLFNFVDFIGTRRSIETGATIEHLDLTSDEWMIEICSTAKTKENFEALKAEGGYRLTHIVTFQKPDKKAFTAKKAEELIYALQFLLSFAKGAWCDPVCPVGFDQKGHRVWESWSSPRDSWFTPPCWFYPLTGSDLASLFQGFIKCWANDGWRDTLHEVIYWYLGANNSARGIDAGIILTQTAIERLSYQFVVNEKRLLTPKGFKDLWASDKFRLLFSSLGLPLDLPKETIELKALSGHKDFKWLDAPHVLTEIRNSLVHPDHKARGKVRSAYFEAWSLGLWYLELAILNICGYSNNYVNRLKNASVARIDMVPWIL